MPKIDPRKPRELQSRDKSREPSWTPPGLLPEPTPRDGWKHRWVATSVLGVDNSTNVGQRFREGWEACRADDYPEIVAAISPNGRTNKDSSTTSNLLIGGLMLCRMPEELAAQRQAYYEQLSARHLEAVNKNPLKQEHHHMPVVNDSTSRTKFGSGSSEE